MTNAHADYIPINEFLDLLEVLDLNYKEAAPFCGLKGSGQITNWIRKGRMPAAKFWAFRTGVVIFLEEEKIRKMVKLGIISKEFLEELING